MGGLQNEIGKGSFQELDQVEAVRQYCKYAGRATAVQDIGPIITAAVKVGEPLIFLLPKLILGPGVVRRCRQCTFVPLLSVCACARACGTACVHACLVGGALHDCVACMGAHKRVHATSKPPCFCTSFTAIAFGSR